MSYCDEACLRLDSDISIEEATNMVSVISRKFILPDPRKLAFSFGLRWNFCTARSSMGIKCNRATRHGSRQTQSLRSGRSITCSCDWSIRFRGTCRNTNKISDPVVITTVNEVYFNTRIPYYIDQFMLSRTWASDYKYCSDQTLREIMIQIAIDPFENIRVMIELL